MFTDDVVMEGENLEKVNSRLGESRLALEGKELWISRSKTKFFRV